MTKETTMSKTREQLCTEALAGIRNPAEIRSLLWEVGVLAAARWHDPDYAALLKAIAALDAEPEAKP